MARISGTQACLTATWEDWLKKEFVGGKGGQGGQGSNQGGNGGFGQAPQMSALDAQRFFEINDGIGGLGGRGGNQDGLDGVGQVFVPHLTISDFCQRFQLSEGISRLLQEKGFETARMLLEVDDAALTSVGLEAGQIAEVRRGLKEFLVKAQL
ncbi:hypothetical protein B0H14DRAFT_152412 [Mycena olivaceomarginata]|nr:hypothetical protein B0H14DRAFT_152412 [Mycena olivaceomarginata]